LSWTDEWELPSLADEVTDAGIGTQGWIDLYLMEELGVDPDATFQKALAEVGVRYPSVSEALLRVIAHRVRPLTAGEGDAQSVAYALYELERDLKLSGESMWERAPLYELRDFMHEARTWVDAGLALTDVATFESGARQAARAWLKKHKARLRG
jgi:hypothetical protein